MANINFNSYNEILGKMIRKLIADSPANDINKGSVLLTLLEAAAANDFDNNTAILNVLELLNIDALKNNDLDAYASNFGLERRTAIKSTGFIRIKDSNIQKRSTTLYSIKPAPIAGNTVLFVNNAEEWAQSGALYIGRGTSNFEGPISYSSIVDNGSFYTINLDAALEKDHLLSEDVIDSQGTVDRQVLAGTIIKTPANNISPEIQYVVLRDAVLPSGEDTVEGMSITAARAGSSGNAGINTITLFGTTPFSGATVANTNALINGRDIESDNDFRDRVKAYSSSLARGTKRAILSAIDGISDETDGKQVTSAVITEPSQIGDPSIVYIDDGSGFEPSFAGQSVDLLVSTANGSEQFLQLSNYPIPRPQVINTAEAPFVLIDGSELRVLVDGIEESVVFTTNDFRSITAATIFEVIVAINSKAISFKARLSESSTRILIYTTDYKSEKIQVVSGSANNQLRFPVNELSYIALYKNNQRLNEVERSGFINTNPFSTWDITAPGNLVLSIDGTPEQDRSFSTADFGGATLTSLSVQDWARVFNSKFAGITVTTTDTGRMVVSSNRVGSASSIEAVSGSYLEKMFSGQNLTSFGQDSDFALNRQNGNLELTSALSVNDSITAGSADTKGAVFSKSAVGGTFNVSTDTNGRPSDLVIIVDAKKVETRAVNLAVGSTISISNEGAGVMRLTADSLIALRDIQVDDYFYIANRGDNDGLGLGTWIDIKSSGLFRVTAKGNHLASGIDTYIETINSDIVAGGPYVVSDPVDVQAFYSDKYPQIWNGNMTPVPALSPIIDIVNSINSNINNISASVFKTNFIKITSTTENSGSIAIPVSIGSSAAQLFATSGSNNVGSNSHIATQVQQIDSISTFKRTATSNSNVWLGRYIHTDVRGSLTTDVIPSKDGSGAYSEIIEDSSAAFASNLNYNNAFNITSGQNKGQTRDIKDIISNTEAGTRHDIPKTILDYKVGDEYQVVDLLGFSPDDNIVITLDNNASAKTIDIPFSRTGSINNGSQLAVFIPNNLEFSANDYDNEPGIDFGTLSVWGTDVTQSKTDFNDYSIWFKARNWYASNGSNIIVRAKEFGPIGDKISFKIDLPTSPNNESSISHVNSPDSTDVVYFYGSGDIAIIDTTPGDQFTIDDIGSNYARITLPTSANITGVNIGDVISISAISGFSTDNVGAFSVSNKNDTNKTIDIYNPNAQFTVTGIPQAESIQTVADIADSLDGSFFIIEDQNGDTIKFWFDNNDDGTIEPSIGLTDRSHEINTITNDTANDVAIAVAAVMLNDPSVATAVVTGSIIDFTFTDNGPSTLGSDGVIPTNFTFSVTTNGVFDTFETLNILSGLVVFPLVENSTSEIAERINESSVIEAVVVTHGTLTRATREEDSLPIDGLSFGHNPNPVSELNEQISLYDSMTHVLDFQNANPNFTLKTPLILTGASANYDISAVPNVDGSIGEQFKLVPVTLRNIEHQLTNRALSQLNIVASVDVSNDGKKLQIKSNELGSDGAIEIIGGRANIAELDIIGSTSVSVSNGIDYLKAVVPANPNTITPGQYVKLENRFGVDRLSRSLSSDSMDVVQVGASTFEYKYNNKKTNFNKYVKFNIVDANSVDPILYPDAGIVWRWTHSDSGSSANIQDIAIGVVSFQPANYNASGLLNGAPNIAIDIADAGSVTTKHSFNVTIIDTPDQADYFTFINSSGEDYAVWIDIDGAGTPPSGANYLSASNQLMIEILSTDTPSQIASKITSDLITVPIDFDVNVTPTASLSEVREGDIVNPMGDLIGWPHTNKSSEGGDGNVSGYTIVKTNTINRYFDVVNVNGTSMADTLIGDDSQILISTSPLIKWNLKHSSKLVIESVTILSGVATATTSSPHYLNVGDVFFVSDMPANIQPSVPGASTGTVVSVIGVNQFTYASTEADIVVSPAGFAIKTLSNETKYKIESLDYNGLFRLSAVSGDSPRFTACGVAIDDIIKISGSTFNSINLGEFRVIAVDDMSVIYENNNATEELNTIKDLNNFNIEVSWTSGSDQVTGLAGAFSNIAIGDWIKKRTDDAILYRQVAAFNTGLASTATIVTLGDSYEGITSAGVGIAFDQINSVGTGVVLKNTADIEFIEGDSVMLGDRLFISSSSASTWFTVTNSGTFTINAIGTSASDGRIFLRVNNLVGIAQSNVLRSTPNTNFVITESDANKFSTIKQVHHVAIDEFNEEKRVIYLTPADRSYRWSENNETVLSSIGKLSYNQDVIAGVDGYLYYTGLLRKVQRVIDGFEPDPVSFPGRKAVGSLIEVLPPLPRRISVSIDVTTMDGINLSEINDEIVSSIISYVGNLGVGEDVILSDIIVRVKNINGVKAVTFISPAPSEELIPIASDEKAFISVNNISVS